MRKAAFLLTLASCHGASQQQLTNCRIIAKTGDALTGCLVLKYDWKGQVAAQEGNRWQAHQDSIAAQLEALRIQALARENDSLLKVSKALRDSIARAERADSTAAAEIWACHKVAHSLTLNIEIEVDAACDTIGGRRARSFARKVAAVDSQFQDCFGKHGPPCMETARGQLAALGLRDLPF